MEDQGIPEQLGVFPLSSLTFPLSSLAFLALPWAPRNSLRGGTFKEVRVGSSRPSSWVFPGLPGTPFWDVLSKR